MSAHGNRTYVGTPPLGSKEVDGMGTLEKRLYSEKETAKYLGRSVWAVREMRYAGKLQFIKDGKRVLFDIVDLNEWIEKSKTRFTY